MIRILIAGAFCAVFLVAGCATLPDSDAMTRRYATQAARFESARGTLSAKRTAAIVAELQRKSGDLDILDKQVVLEQQIGGSALTVGNKVVLLQDGPATYQAMFEAIRGAKDHVNMESYIIEDGEIGERFAELLLERQAHGVQVNIIYDSAGTFGTGAAFFARLREAGVEVLEFNPINPLAAKKSWAPDHRDHRKLLIVDGRTAILGGVNISSVYSTGSSPHGGRDAAADLTTGWRDTDIAVEGPAVAEFQKLFMDTWQKQNGKALAPKDYFPALGSQGAEIVRAIGSTPDDEYSLVYLTLISAIATAEKQVHLINAYFVPDPQLVRALLDAAARGVDVKIILAAHTDSSSAHYAGRSHYGELLEGGVKIYERRGGLVHAKTAVVDEVWSLVGSSNLDWRSALDNDEINAVILSRDFAARMEASYAGDIAASDRIELDAWNKRPFALRIREWAAHSWERLL